MDPDNFRVSKTFYSFVPWPFYGIGHGVSLVPLAAAAAAAVAAVISTSHLGTTHARPDTIAPVLTRARRVYT